MTSGIVPDDDPVARLLAWVERTPDAPAVLEAGEVITYADFGERVCRLAAAIAQHGDHPKTLIELKQGAWAYAAMFATLMAGGFYSPLNLDAPPHRQSLIRQGFRPDLVITDTKQMSQLAASAYQGPSIVVPDLGHDRLDRPRPPGRLAYVMFTSGSTGVPKGVMIPRRALSHYLAWALPALAITSDDRVSQHPNVGFDLSVLDIYVALCGGAALAPLTSAKHRLLPAEAIKDLRLTVWISVPSVVDLMRKARGMPSQDLASLRLLFFCGEPLLRAHVDWIFSVLPDVSVMNTYGPTEATVSCTQVRLSAPSYASACRASVALGDAIPDMELRLIGGPNRDEGEIVIFGPQLADGYWQDDAKTAATFRAVEGRTGYFTGDWARRDGDHLYFVSRTDRQVKIHGHRIELGEIDAAVRAAGAAGSYTLAANGELVSFIEGAGEGVRTIQDRIKATLPPYMLPSRILVLDQLPRNTNDKIDALALQAMLQSEKPGRGDTTQ